MRSIFKIIFFLLLSQTVFSQNLTEDSVFFRKQVSAFNEWIKETGFDKVLDYENLEIDSDKVILRFSLKSDSDWFGLKKAYNAENPNSINELLFSRMTHLFELPRENAEIRLSDHKNYYVNISYLANKLNVNEPSPRGLVTNSIDIPIIKINKLHTKKTNDAVVDNVEVVKNIIDNYLRNYYKVKTARFSKANVKVLQDENSVYAKINNITKEIISDGLIGYWELIDIVIKVEQDSSVVRINYTLQGKYGAGIFLAPRQNDYVDMERDYKSYLDTYNEQLKSNIRNELLKKN